MNCFWLCITGAIIVTATKSLPRKPKYGEYTTHTTDPAKLCEGIRKDDEKTTKGNANNGGAKKGGVKTATASDNITSYNLDPRNENDPAKRSASVTYKFKCYDGNPQAEILECIYKSWRTEILGETVKQGDCHLLDSSYYGQGAFCRGCDAADGAFVSASN